MPDYAVGMKFTGKETVSATMKRMGKQADASGKRMSSAFRNATKAGFDFQTIVKGIVAANLLRGGIGQITQGLDSVLRGFVRFDETMIGAAARFADIGPDATDFADRLLDLKDKTRLAAQGTRFTVGQLGDTMNTFAKTGITSTQAFGQLIPVMNLAKAAQEDLGFATSVASDLMGSFELRSKDAATNSRNMVRVSDVLTKAILSANVSLEDMFEALKTVGPVAVSYGANLEQAAKLTAFLGNAGIKGTLAATALKNAMVRIPSARISRELEANGVAVLGLDKKMRPLVDIIADMGAKMKNLDPKQQMQIFERVFGLRAIAGAGALMRGIDALGELQHSLETAQGVAQRTGDRIEQSLLSKLLKLGSAALEAGFKVLDAFEHKGRKGIDALTLAVKEFKVEPIVQSISLLVNTMTALWNASKPIRAIMPELIAGWVAYNAVLKGAALLETVMLMGRLWTAGKLAIGAMSMLNLVMAANPVGLIAVGVAAVVAAFVFLERKFGVFSKTLKFIWGLINDMWRIASKIFGIQIPALGDIGVSIAKAQESQERALRVAPNEKDAAAAQINFKGRLDIAGAPEGSSFKSTTNGAPPLDHALFGGAL